MTVNDGLGVEDKQKNTVKLAYYFYTPLDHHQHRHIPPLLSSKIKYLDETWLLLARSRTCTLRTKKNYSIVKKPVYINTLIRFVQNYLTAVNYFHTYYDK
jgi:hypothetical protein